MAGHGHFQATCWYVGNKFFERARVQLGCMNLARAGMSLVAFFDREECGAVLPEVVRKLIGSNAKKH